MDFGADELEYDDKGDDDDSNDDDERLMSHGKAATRSGGRFRARRRCRRCSRCEPVLVLVEEECVFFVIGRISRVTIASVRVESRGRWRMPRESPNGRLNERENEKLREKLKRMENPWSCKSVRVGPTETRRRGASGRGESEGREDEIRRARGDYFVEGQERELEEFGKMAKEAERKKNNEEHALTMRANSRKLERENARLRTAATEMEERMEQIVSMNERSGRSISEIVRSSPVKRYPQLVASRRETEEKEGKKEEEEEQEEETEIPIATTTTTSTSNIAAGTRTNAVRLQSPSWSWFRDETEDATNITRPPLVSRRNASLSAKKKEVDTAPPYATSADLLASNLLRRATRKTSPFFPPNAISSPTFSHEIFQRCR